MVLQNCEKLLNDLSKIEKEIDDLEELARSCGLQLSDKETLLKVYLLKKQNEAS